MWVIASRPVDDKDVSILEILESNARIPWRRLARLLNLSEATIYLRIRRLEESGVLRGFTAVIDPVSLGLSTIIFVLLKVSPSKLSSVKEDLRNLEFVQEAYEITGEYQIMVKITAPGQGEAAEAIEKIASLDGVNDYSTIATLQTVKSSPRIVRIYKYWAGGSASESPRPQAGQTA